MEQWRCHAVLHTRILCDIFLSKSIGADDIQLSTLLPDYDTDAKYIKLKKLTDNLRASYGNAGTHGSPRWVFNKMLAHPTIQRGDCYDYESILLDLQLHIHPVIREIESLMGAPFARDFVYP